MELPVASALHWHGTPAGVCDALGVKHRQGPYQRQRCTAFARPGNIALCAHALPREMPVSRPPRVGGWGDMLDWSFGKPLLPIH